MSNVTGIEELMEGYDIEMYPHPLKDKMHISHKEQSVNMGVEIINAVGQKVYSGHLQEGTETVLSLEF